jgi:hypothetical protein
VPGVRDLAFQPDRLADAIREALDRRSLRLVCVACGRLIDTFRVVCVRLLGVGVCVVCDRLLGVGVCVVSDYLLGVCRVRLLGVCCVRLVGVCRVRLLGIRTVSRGAELEARVLGRLAVGVRWRRLVTDRRCVVCVVGVCVACVVGVCTARVVRLTALVVACVCTALVTRLTALLVAALVDCRRLSFPFAVLNERAAELPFGLSDRPREVNVPVVADVLHLHVDGVARLPVQRLQPLVQLRPVEEPGDARREVDEHAEVGVAVDRAAVEPSCTQQRGVCSLELEDDVLLVGATDPTVGGGPTDDARTHSVYQSVPRLKLLSEREPVAEHDRPRWEGREHDPRDRQPVHLAEADDEEIPPVQTTARPQFRHREPGDRTRCGGVGDHLDGLADAAAVGRPEPAVTVPAGP